MNIIDPHLIFSPKNEKIIEQKINCKQLTSTGSNFKVYEIVKVNEDIFEIRKTIGLNIFILISFLLPLILLRFYLNWIIPYINKYFEFTIWPLLFIAFVYFINRRKYVFNKNLGFKSKSSNEYILLNQIIAIQIIKKKSKVDGHWNYYLELNLVLSNEERINVLDQTCDDLETINEAIALGEFLKVPVWTNIKI